MFQKIGLLTLTILYCLTTQATHPKKVQIRLQLSAADSSKIELRQFDVFSKGLDYYYPVPFYQTGNTQITTWELPAEKTVGIYIKINQQDYFTYLEPGSDITLQVHSGKVDVSGPGSEVFYTVNNELVPQITALAMPNHPFNPLKDLAGYNAWNAYFDKKSAIIHHIIDKHASAYPGNEVWDILRSQYISEVEYQRAQNFLRINGSRAEFKLSEADIRKIYHSVICNKNMQWLLSQEKESPNIGNYLRFIVTVSELLYPTSDPRYEYLLHSHGIEDKMKINLRIIDSLTTGLLKDQLITYMILDRLAKPGRIDVANDILPQALPLIKKTENKKYLIDAIAAIAREYAPYELSELYLLDINGKPVKRRDMVLKTLVLHVKDNSGSSRKPDPLFQSAVKEFANQPDVILAEVSHGMSFKDWQKEAQRIPMANSPVMQLYAPKTGDHLDFMETIYAPQKAATMVYYQYKATSVHKNILRSQWFVQALKKGADTISTAMEAIRNEAIKFDGPYVRTLADTTFTYHISQSSPRIDTLLEQRLTEIEVPVDLYGNSFHVQIKETPLTGLSRYPMPDKVLILSDIEGNFGAFRELLVNNRVMDSSYNWIFGEGHLVITGDVFDRGRHVTGCLWLIYMLEQKARQAGGDVHFILGNHEIMNLTGDFRYVYPDYKLFAGMLGINYADLYDKNSILGKWLRSKNIIEIIGEHLIVHAGISPELNSLGLSVEEINNMHRLFLAGQPAAPTDTIMGILLDGKVSPYWYRGYYRTNFGQKTPESVIDSTLALFNVQKIITGHTVVEDISAFYGGKVINTDTHHAKGDSEALLIEGKNYYRVNLHGMRFKLP